MRHKKYSDADVVKISTIVKFGGRIFQQIIGIPIETNCAPMLADLCFYSRMRQSLYRAIKRLTQQYGDQTCFFMH